MMKKILLSFAFCVLPVVASADWQYSGNYTRDGYYRDDGARFIVSLRGGASMANAKIQNEVGALTSVYYVDSNNVPISAYCYDNCGINQSDFTQAGYGNIGDLGAANDFSNVAFAAGFSVGGTIPNTPQWRLEAAWEHITESEYNAEPLFRGNLELSNGSSYEIESGGAQSTVNTDIFSVMAFYDFYDGMSKPLHQMIPYVGLGFGYGYSTTTMKMSDLYGDLAYAGLSDYGETNATGFVDFYQSKKSTANIAGLAAVGISYGIATGTYLDFGVRLTYLPKIKFALSNEDGTVHRDWFSAKDVIYTNIMAGVRFEF